MTTASIFPTWLIQNSILWHLLKAMDASTKTHDVYQALEIAVCAVSLDERRSNEEIHRTAFRIVFGEDNQDSILSSVIICKQ